MRWQWCHQDEIKEMFLARCHKSQGELEFERF
ncbi:hypothetical protein E2C01_028438 [Portunus trituberculatus]|uniref:Uncharacterized protein n=1 Tax=Portunus trituberculatus TaxID=210409 RepID=A0A5B7EPG5_PORTR|nr:hypothetical protein [Portunus trituberculatus]